MLSSDNLSSIEALIRVGGMIQQRGWCPATSGNLSARDSGESCFYISRSGKYKGELHVSDFLKVDASGKLLDQNGKPSAETLLHALVYQRFERARFVLHSHSLYGTIMSKAQGKGCLVFEDYELQKAFSGIETHAGQLAVPVFANRQDMKALSVEIADYFATADRVHGFLLAGHGLYTWGDSLDEAWRHLEALEFLLECEYKIRLLPSA